MNHVLTDLMNKIGVVKDALFPLCTDNVELFSMQIHGCTDVSRLVCVRDYLVISRAVGEIAHKYKIPVEHFDFDFTRAFFMLCEVISRIKVLSNEQLDNLR